MEERLKIGLTLIIMGSLIFFVGYDLLSEFREREEDINRVHPEETITEHGGILALNFCGGVFLLAGIIIILMKIFDIELKGGEDNL
ncbi:MAG: hypothetical protein KGY66_04620 [Candidatus Thermoplasmatota archaeon]|nr:hypothetical protein [Candidatus Thermoplasmatota archaeon]MBS3790181.1 hypothetical protein [Candidatus Thermoplasmatota archaeon]